MHLAARASATPVPPRHHRRLPRPRPRRWASPLVLAGLALGSACSVDPRGAVAPASPSPAPRTSSASGQPATGTTQIRVVVGTRTFVGELDDNPTAHDLADRLPLEVTMADHQGTEKTGPLSRALTTDGAPRGSDPEMGEIGYYAPGQDLVFYYGDQGYYPGIVRIGRFSEDIDALADEADGLTARVEVR